MILVSFDSEFYNKFSDTIFINIDLRVLKIFAKNEPLGLLGKTLKSTLFLLIN